MPLSLQNYWTSSIIALLYHHGNPALPSNNTVGSRGFTTLIMNYKRFGVKICDNYSQTCLQMPLKGPRKHCLYSHVIFIHRSNCVEIHLFRPWESGHIKQIFFPKRYTWRQYVYVYNGCASKSCPDGCAQQMSQCKYIICYF